MVIFDIIDHLIVFDHLADFSVVFFSETVLCRMLRFFALHQNSSFELSKSTI